MAAYLVLSPVGADAYDPENRFVRDGFSWAGAIFPALSALAYGLYFDAVGLAIARGAAWMALADSRFSSAALAVLAATSLVYGFEIRNRYANRLAGKGFQLRSAIVARNLGEAEEIFYAGTPSLAVSTPIAEFQAVAAPAPVGHGPATLGMVAFEKGRR